MSKETLRLFLSHRDISVNSMLKQSSALAYRRVNMDNTAFPDKAI
jgi:hypothetical protein